MEDADLDSLLVYFESFETLSDEEIDKMATGEHSYIFIRAALRKFVRLHKPVQVRVNNQNSTKLAFHYKLQLIIPE